MELSKFLEYYYNNLDKKYLPIDPIFKYKDLYLNYYNKNDYKTLFSIKYIDFILFKNINKKKLFDIIQKQQKNIKEENIEFDEKYYYKFYKKIFKDLFSIDFNILYNSIKDFLDKINYDNLKDILFRYNNKIWQIILELDIDIKKSDDYIAYFDWQNIYINLESLKKDFLYGFWLLFFIENYNSIKRYNINITFNLVKELFSDLKKFFLDTVNFLIMHEIWHALFNSLDILDVLYNKYNFDKQLTLKYVNLIDDSFINSLITVLYKNLDLNTNLYSFYKKKSNIWYNPFVNTIIINNFNVFQWINFWNIYESLEIDNICKKIEKLYYKNQIYKQIKTSIKQEDFIFLDDNEIKKLIWSKKIKIDLNKIKKDLKIFKNRIKNRFKNLRLIDNNKLISEYLLSLINLIINRNFDENIRKRIKDHLLSNIIISLWKWNVDIHDYLDKLENEDFQEKIKKDKQEVNKKIDGLKEKFKENMIGTEIWNMYYNIYIQNNIVFKLNKLFEDIKQDILKKRKKYNYIDLKKYYKRWIIDGKLMPENKIINQILIDVSWSMNKDTINKITSGLVNITKKWKSLNINIYNVLAFFDVVLSDIYIFEKEIPEVINTIGWWWTALSANLKLFNKKIEYWKGKFYYDNKEINYTKIKRFLSNDKRNLIIVSDFFLFDEDLKRLVDYLNDPKINKFYKKIYIIDVWWWFDYKKYKINNSIYIKF